MTHDRKTRLLLVAATAPAGLIAIVPHLAPRTPACFLGLSSDFWTGFPMGALIGLQLFAVALLVRGGRGRAC